MTARLFVVALLAGAVAVAATLVDLREHAPRRTLATPEDSDYYMFDADIEQMDDQGRLRYRMHAAKVLHYPDDSARMQDIRVRYHGEEPTPWTLDAASGRKPAESEDIHLSGGVVVRHELPNFGPARLETDSVWLRHDEDVVETHDEVRANAPGRTATAAGMTVHLDDNRIILNRDVKVTYAP